MITVDFNIRSYTASETCRVFGIAHGELAKGIDAYQAQASRILAVRVKRLSRLFENTCCYVERRSGWGAADFVKTNDELDTALQGPWNGSAVHAKELAIRIPSMAVLGSAGENKTC